MWNEMVEQLGREVEEGRRVKEGRAARPRDEKGCFRGKSCVVSTVVLL